MVSRMQGRSNMNFNPKIFLIRLIMGLVAGWFLTKFFLAKGPEFTSGDWITAGVLAVIVIAAAYVSESWRNKNQ
jgi:ABC-type amino acid transport system permease subunit